MVVAGRREARRSGRLPGRVTYAGQTAMVGLIRANPCPLLNRQSRNGGPGATPPSVGQVSNLSDGPKKGDTSEPAFGSLGSLARARGASDCSPSTCASISRLPTLAALLHLAALLGSLARLRLRPGLNCPDARHFTARSYSVYRSLGRQLRRRFGPSRQFEGVREITGNRLSRSGGSSDLTDVPP